MGPILAGQARRIEDAARHVEKAREDPIWKESPESLCALSSYADAHFQFFLAETETID